MNVLRVPNLLIGGAFFIGVTVWLYYLAVEPFVRRRWPHLLIAWTRLLSGGYRDPLIGAQLLTGGAFGVALVVLERHLRRVPGRTILQALLDTGRYPATVYPIWLRVIVTFVVPIAVATTVPLQALRGDLASWQVLLFLGVSAASFFVASRISREM